MIGLKDFLQVLKQSNLFENYYIGRIDKSKNNSVCIYNLGNRNNNRICVGGKQYNGYEVKGFSLLIQGSSSIDLTEKLAHNLYTYLEQTEISTIGDNEVCYIELLHDAPIDVSDSNNSVSKGTIYEFVIELNIYYNNK